MEFSPECCLCRNKADNYCGCNAVFICEPCMENHMQIQIDHFVLKLEDFIVLMNKGKVAQERLKKPKWSK